MALVGECGMIKLELSFKSHGRCLISKERNDSRGVWGIKSEEWTGFQKLIGLGNKEKALNHDLYF